jgi:glycosyltransferase involved in cell wall biosynthesis
MPAVSVIMAVRDGAATLAEALTSILAQSGPALELIVVDDGSADDTPAILADTADPRLKLLRNDRSLGLAASLNRAAESATGQWLARMDADDISLPGRLAAQLAHAGAADICFGRAELFGDQHGHWRESPWPLTLWRGLFDNFYGVHPTALIRTDSFRRLGGYDATFKRAQDYELWDRAVAAGLRFAYCPETVLRYRVHGDGLRDEQVAAAATVSARALARAFPDAGAEELAGLRWLMLSWAPEPPSCAVAKALDGVVDRARTFAGEVGGRSAIMAEVGSRLARRVGRLSPPLAASARRQMARAALVGPSLKPLVGLARSLRPVI